MKSSASELGLRFFWDFSQFATDASENNKSTSGYTFVVFLRTLFILLVHSFSFFLQTNICSKKLFIVQDFL